MKVIKSLRIVHIPYPEVGIWGTCKRSEVYPLIIPTAPRQMSCYRHHIPTWLVVSNICCATIQEGLLAQMTNIFVWDRLKLPTTKKNTKHPLSFPYLPCWFSLSPAGYSHCRGAFPCGSALAAALATPRAGVALWTMEVCPWRNMENTWKNMRKPSIFLCAKYGTIVRI